MIDVEHNIKIQITVLHRNSHKSKQTWEGKSRPSKGIAALLPILPISRLQSIKFHIVSSPFFPLLTFFPSGLWDLGNVQKPLVLLFPFITFINGLAASNDASHVGIAIRKFMQPEH